EDKEKKDAVQRKLTEQGIPAMAYYPRPLHAQTVFSSLGQDSCLFPNSARAAQTVLSLPIHPYLSQADVARVSDQIKGFMTAFGGRR
ncbi:MAG: DegT/DnrJ/EryC1/StrS family aminotransferase, partial [Eubacteriales bacterium]